MFFNLWVGLSILNWNLNEDDKSGPKAILHSKKKNQIGPQQIAFQIELIMSTVLQLLMTSFFNI